MDALNVTSVQTRYGKKEIAVFSCNILDFDMEIDVLTTSAFYRSYAPTPNTMFAALDVAGIPVWRLSLNPAIDLRKLCNLWLSGEIKQSKLKVHRIGCIEMSRYDVSTASGKCSESDILTSIKMYFKMLDMASECGIKIETVAMPLLGSGNQKISSDLTLIPMINECIEFLNNNEFVKKIYFIDYNQSNAFKMALMLEKSYSLKKASSDNLMTDKNTRPVSESMVFISYTGDDRNVADNLCAKFESKGMRVWYAPRNIHNNDYASAIVEAITVCTHFVVIISKKSMMSEHVLNEIDLAFKQLGRGIRFLPLRIDKEELRSSFSYYLSRQHWMDAYDPPLEQRLDEFVNGIVQECNGQM